MTTSFSQRDARWGQTRLGRSALTIGEAGCLLTAVTSILADWQVGGTPEQGIDPAWLNAWLVTHNGYVDGSRFVLGAVEPLGVRLRAWVDYYCIPANLARLAKALAAGWGVLALIDAQPGADVQAHWVRLLAVGGSGTQGRRDCLIMDPWQLPGAEVGSLVARYGRRGWDAGRAIFVYVAYETWRGKAACLTRRRLCQRALDEPVELCWRAR